MDGSKTPDFVRDFSQPAFDLNGKSILVTGGTGSFGKAFITLYSEALQARAPRRLLARRAQAVRDGAGSDRHASTRACATSSATCAIAQRLEMAMSGIDYVVHAAALKQVPIAEYNPFECIHTNVIGAENVVRAAPSGPGSREWSRSRPTRPPTRSISMAPPSSRPTRSSSPPTTCPAPRRPRFSVVRYGNVMGSRGSVVPFFQKSHSRRRRRAADHARGDDPLLDHARPGRRLRALVVRHDAGRRDLRAENSVDAGSSIWPRRWPRKLPIKIIGIRPGEKLHEVMVSEDDARNTVELADRYAILPQFHGWDAAQAPRRRARKPVPEGFRYASNTNTEWLAGDDFQAMLRLSGAADGRAVPPLWPADASRTTDIAAVVAALKSDYLTTGPRVAEFEKAFAGLRRRQPCGGLRQWHCGLASGGAGCRIGQGDSVVVLVDDVPRHRQCRALRRRRSGVRGLRSRARH